MANQTYTFTLPSGSEVTFRSPFGADRVNVIQMLKMSLESIAGNTLMIDGYVAVKCITAYGGNPADGNYKALYDSLPQEDLDFYLAVFEELFGMSKDKRAEAKEAAAFLRKGQTYIASFNSQSTPTPLATTDG
ncbi:hypothetical protein [uncultured Anaeromusa sp.]|uniref:hypothetical protein n=1 Tax=uncultured Anaeromusa sp. TaxID=673273 RepID=UPI0029C8CE6B|nr:hypothetical protein [uncultured Anaeromusa sp.]